MLAMVAMTAALWTFVLFARVLLTPVVLLAWCGVAALIAAGLWRGARRRRRVWLHAYLQPQSVLAQRLRGGLLMALWQLLVALLLSAFLLLLLIRNTDTALWSALLLAGLALPPLTALLSRFLRGHLLPLYLQDLALAPARVLLFLPLWAWVVWLSYGASYPDFREAGLDQAVWHMVSAQQARSGVLHLLLELGAAMEGMTLWLAQRLLPAPAESLWQALGWILLLARDALFVWSYLLLCRGTLALISAPAVPSIPSTGE